VQGAREYKKLATYIKRADIWPHMSQKACMYEKRPVKRTKETCKKDMRPYVNRELYSRKETHLEYVRTLMSESMYMYA